MPTASDIAEVETATLCLINQIRVQHHEHPLIDNGKLHLSAQRHSEDMVSEDYFEHTSPSGESFSTRIAATGYLPAGDLFEIGENIEIATLSLATPSQAVDSWMNSRPHRENILNEEFRETGLGIVPSAPAELAKGAPGATYTQDFGIVVHE